MVTAAANGVILVAYTAISLAIARGLWRSGQWRHNLLGVATAAIFVTCAVHHGSHTVHMLLPSFGVHSHSGLAMRHAFGDGYQVAAWDIVTAAVAIWYWGLRNRFPALVQGAAVFDDLRLREAAERQLRASEERYRRIVETTSEGVLTIDAAGVITFANPRMGVIVGSPSEDLVGRPIIDLIPPEDRAEMLRRLDRRRSGADERYQIRLGSRGGTEVWVQVSATALLDEHGRYEGRLALLTDITEQKSLEAQFRQAQKLEAVGQLAGGVAHDFNNLLTVIDGYAAMVVDEVGEQQRQDILAIRGAAARAHGLTRQLLTFSRVQVTQRRLLDVNEVVLGIHDMLRRLIGEDVHLVIEPAGVPAVVHADQGQLEQVLVNLAVNARDAMPGGGRLTIRVGRAELTGASAALADRGPGGYVTLAVADTGRGMTADVQARIFEPFFTTKDPDKGTGLGLATTYGIVREAGGHIEVDSEPGHGTVFRVYLPAVSTTADPSTPSVVPAAVDPGPAMSDHRETVLLVEDDAAVRVLAERILRAAGYRVLAASDAEQAIRLADPAGPLDLLLTDVVMPGLNGRQLAERLLRKRPALPVLFTSAYARGIISERGILHHSVSYLEKPYTPPQLLGAVRTVLDTPVRHRPGSTVSTPETAPSASGEGRGAARWQR